MLFLLIFTAVVCSLIMLLSVCWGKKKFPSVKVLPLSLHTSLYGSVGAHSLLALAAVPSMVAYQCNLEYHPVSTCYERFKGANLV